MNANWFIRARLKQRHLLVLAALGDTCNLKHAADGLGISQPAISKLLKELEDALDVQLFERQARGVIPTPYGETMIRHARHLLSTLDGAYAEINAMRHGQSGQVRLGTILTPCADLIPETLNKVRRSHPDLEISIQTGSSEQLLAALDDGELDILVARYIDKQNQYSFHYEPMYQEPINVCARAGHPLIRAGRRLSPADLQHEDWVLPPGGSVMRAEFEALFYRAAMLPPTRIVTAENLLIITNLLEQNNMLTLLPEGVVQHYMRYKLLTQVPLETDVQKDLDRNLAPYGLIVRDKTVLSPAGKAVLEALRQGKNNRYPG
ncbi:LysR substrate-binding domain-containing protein [Marinobacterium rhizophilum]|uniref:LysR substrate-binding domain-containing protein n=1 Tax=Marinobacterium rhizophilum TaxID=420402 RepID=UPI001F0AB1F7|nr:LysR substrate-binding domain-containing protein [Marinobacterium rhizophilum]